MQEEILRGKEAREAILKGVNTLADTIKITLGPKGRNVIISNDFLTPYITNDGATIAREITLVDPLTNIGAEIIKDVALRTNELVGDATTTATILAQSIINDSFKQINDGINGVLLKEALVKQSTQAIKYLKAESKPITNDDLFRIANISCGDEQIAKLISKAHLEAGFNAEILIDENSSNEDRLTIIDGYKFDEGYISSYFINNEKELSCEFDNPYFLVTNNSIYDFSFLENIIEDINRVNGSLVIFSDEIDEVTMSKLIALKLENNLNVVCIKSSSHNSKNDLLSDIATLTKAKYFNYETGKDINNIKLNDLGRSKQIKVFKDYTLIISDSENKDLEDRKDYLNRLISNSNNDFEKEVYQNRLNRLQSKTVILTIGANSKIELKERKMKTEDAICATSAAIKEGVSLGGGVAYLKCSNYLQNNIKPINDIEEMGLKILVNALKTPFIQLLNNAAVDNLDLIMQDIQTSKNNGYDVKNNQIADFYEQGIIDSAMAQRIALESAVSIASTLITTECIVFDKSGSNKVQKEKRDFLMNDSVNGLF